MTARQFRNFHRSLRRDQNVAVRLVPSLDLVPGTILAQDNRNPLCIAWWILIPANREVISAVNGQIWPLSVLNY